MKFGLQTQAAGKEVWFDYFKIESSASLVNITNSKCAGCIGPHSTRASPGGFLLGCLLTRTQEPRPGDVQIPLAPTIRGRLPGRLLRWALAMKTLQTSAKLSFRLKVLSQELWHVLSKDFNINLIGTLWENLVGPHGLASESSHSGCRMTAGCGSHVAADIRCI